MKIFEGDLLNATVFDCFDNDRHYMLEVRYLGTCFMGVLDEDNAWDLFWLLQQDPELRVAGNIYEPTIPQHKDE